MQLPSALGTAGVLAAHVARVAAYAPFTTLPDATDTLKDAERDHPGPWHILAENPDVGKQWAHIKHIWKTATTGYDHLVIEYQHDVSFPDPPAWDIAVHPSEPSWFTLHEARSAGTADEPNIGPTIRMEAYPDTTFIDGWLDLQAFVVDYPTEYIYREFALGKNKLIPTFPTMWFQTDKDLNLRIVEGGYHKQTWNVCYKTDAKGNDYQVLTTYGASGGSPLGADCAYIHLRLVEQAKN